MRSHVRIGLMLTLATVSLPAAYAYSVQPMIYSLTPSGSGASARITITNSKEGLLNVEIEPYSVVADDAGKRTFTPAPDDFLIFPPQASIQGDKSQLFQVRYVGAPTLAKGKVYVLRVRQMNTIDLVKPQDPAAQTQTQLKMSVNFNTTAIVQPREMTPKISVERDLAPDANGILRGRITNTGVGVADLTRVAWGLDRAGKQEAIAQDQVKYGEAIFLEPGHSRDIALSDKIRTPARLVLTQPGDKNGARRS
ncbi:hypothetical protein M9980_13805 [Sphingomonas donggukensis]|uniref:Molecular chaperone n=1 Tax=Sphingomonas donggukensis TaxID=2949093 RepID=A0ABY4TUE0_9SPHN|nr:hypothetical protein [Sphingomonas donggukensis]URW75579.1 hypothetical protein M9980_13805 [Sphingomonas donggukensis]